MNVTLYDSKFVRQLLEKIDTDLLNDVANAIEDENSRHCSEDGQITVIQSTSYGTGKGNPLCYSYLRNNWDNSDNSLYVTGIAEGILDNRIKAAEFKLKLEQRNSNTDTQVQQLKELNDKVNRLVDENETLKRENKGLAESEKRERIEKDKVIAENNELLNKLTELEKIIEDKDPENTIISRDIAIAEDRKVDVIKVLHAMCKIGLFQLKNGKKFRIKVVMEYFGKMLNDNFE